MPDGRFVSKQIAQSEQLGAVPLAADYLFTRCIPHLDREGRITGNPILLKAIVCPLQDEIQSGSIPDLLRTLGGQGLILWYEAEGKQVVEFPQFTKHQKGAKFEREAASRFPAFNSETATDLVRTSSGPSPDLVPRARGSEVEVEVEVKEKTSASPSARGPRREPSGWAQNAVQAWTDRFGGVAPGGRIGKALKPLVAKYEEGPVLKAWARYLAEKDAEFATPQDFAGKYLEWTKPVPMADPVPEDRRTKELRERPPLPTIEEARKRQAELRPAEPPTPTAFNNLDLAKVLPPRIA